MRLLKLIPTITLIILLFTGCQADPVIIESTVEVPVTVEVSSTVEVIREVTRIVEVERETIVEVTVPVEVTRVVVVTPRPEDTPMPSPTPEVLANSENFISGTFELSELPTGEEGALTVILIGPVNRRNDMPIVIRNNTGNPVVNTIASVTVRDADGALIGTGEVSDFFPNYLLPGGIAFGEAEFSEAPPANAGYEFRVTAEDQDSRVFYKDLESVEHNLLGDRIVGFLRNSADESLQGIRVAAICLDESLNPIGFTYDYTDQETVGVGEEMAYEVGLDTFNCPYYIVSSKGYGE